MTTELIDYIKQAQEKNLSEEQIKDQLREIGWTKEEIVEAFAQAANLPVPPLPPTGESSIGWTGVISIFFFISLYTLVLAISGILHAWIDKPTIGALTNTVSLTFYDFIASYNATGIITMVQIYLTAIIISYPLLAYFAFILKRTTTKHPMIKNSRLNKLLLFIALISIFLYIISEVIIAGYEFFSGNDPFTTFRHLIIIILVAGGVFAYIVSEIKQIGKRIKKGLLAFIYITALSILALIYGFSLIPSPATERGITYDHKRVIALGLIQGAIDNYYQTNGQLPQTLNDVNMSSTDPSTPAIPLNKIDPETKHPYEYIITSSTDYKLCSLFSTNSSKDDLSGYDDANSDYANFQPQFIHKIGYHCFDESESDSSDSSDSNDPTLQNNTNDFPSPSDISYPSTSPVPSSSRAGQNL